MEFTGFLAGQYHIGVYLSFFIITFYQLKYELIPHFNVSEMGCILQLQLSVHAPR